VGKQDNCQVAAVSVSLANEQTVAWRLCLPRQSADDPGRRAKAGVPDNIGFATKPQIALAQSPALRAGRCQPRGQQRVPAAA
jgi:SRSO17 transposase